MCQSQELSFSSAYLGILRPTRAAVSLISFRLSCSLSMPMLYDSSKACNAGTFKSLRSKGATMLGYGKGLLDPLCVPGHYSPNMHNLWLPEVFAFVLLGLLCSQCF
ncbi:hypothetical protein ABBQ32_013115 [Trebouxia sp. C0010 RCD-2024]